MKRAKTLSLIAISTTLLLGTESLNLPAFAEESAPPPGKKAAESPVEKLLPKEPETRSKQKDVMKANAPNNPRQVLKFGKNFLVMNDRGEIDIEENTGGGLYRDDTRFLSNWLMQVDDAPMSILSKDCRDGYAGHFVYGNKALNQAHSSPEQSILIERDALISDGLRERYKFTNYGYNRAKVKVTVKFNNDFADMFEVRGMGRKKRGEYLPTAIDATNQTVTLSYKGLDNVTMKTFIGFNDLKPTSLKENEAIFEFAIDPRQSQTLEAAVVSSSGEPDPEIFDKASVARELRKFSFEKQLEVANQRYATWLSDGAVVKTGDANLNALLERGYRDIYMLRQATPKGECVAAGIPWFTVAFGRDQEITAMELLPVMPKLAKSVLSVLAEYQGVKNDTYTEERPGKIMHELRLGEMARTREIPFIPYYGTTDATPLWLVLLSRYVEWTGDLDTARHYWPNVERALAYLDSRTETQPYLIYGEKKNAALSNQGWKDSSDSVMYSDGKLINPPVALSEVQGYLYEALNKTAGLAERLEHKELAVKLRGKADALRAKFQADFWMPSKNFCAEAIDGANRQCDVVTSNPGHVLRTGILSEQQQDAVAQGLMGKDMFCGWGVRTLSSKEKDYNPLSYHDGSVWPHDNALIVDGLCSVGHKASGAAILSGISEVSQKTADLRLPELFCGFSKEYSDRPIWYPVSCSPQAWAAGSPFMMLTSLLGLKPDALNKKLVVDAPTLPASVPSVLVNDLRVGESKVSLQFTRKGDSVECRVTSNPHNVTVDVTK